MKRKVHVPQHPLNETTYDSKAATQIFKAIGNQEILKQFDIIRVQLKTKSSQGAKPTPAEKHTYTSVLSQVHMKVLSTKYGLKSNIKAFETECCSVEGGNTQGGQ